MPDEAWSDRERKRLQNLGMCRNDAHESAYFPAVAAGHGMCDACERRFNPPMKKIYKHGRDQWVRKHPPAEKACAVCTRTFVFKRVTAKYCSAYCRKVAERKSDPLQLTPS